MSKNIVFKSLSVLGVFALAFFGTLSFNDFINGDSQSASVASGIPGSSDGLKLISEGSSISIYWSGNYAGVFASEYPHVEVKGLAKSGTKVGSIESRGSRGSSLWGRIDDILAANPTHVSVLIGEHDMIDWRDTNSANEDPSVWLENLFAYTDTLRSEGIKVALATVLPLCVHSDTVSPNYHPTREARRATANNAIREAVGTHIDAVIDFAADSRYGDLEDACDRAKYPDGMHPNGKVKSYMTETYIDVMESLLPERSTPAGGTASHSEQSSDNDHSQASDEVILPDLDDRRIPPVEEPGEGLPSADPDDDSDRNNSSDTFVIAEGDSISVFWSGNYTGRYANAHPDIEFSGMAVGGSGVGSKANKGDGRNTLWNRVDTVIERQPSHVTVLIGANDLGEPKAWTKNLFDYVDELKDEGIEVAVGTILPNCSSGAFNANRAAANNLIRVAGEDRLIDYVIDFAADSRFGDDADACDKQKYGDGVHPTSLVQSYMAEVYSDAMDRFLDGKRYRNPSSGPDWEDEPADDPEPEEEPVTQDFPQAGDFPIIASDFDVDSELVPSWGSGNIAGKNASGVGAFRFICNSSHFAYDDPIVYPGGFGRSHLHMFFGNTLANANSTYESLRTTGMSTCNSPLNRSAYWAPAMLDGKGNAIRPDAIGVYYKRMKKDHERCGTLSRDNQNAGECVNIPRGLRYIFGANLNETSDTHENATFKGHFKCVAENQSTNVSDNIVDAAQDCPIGAQLFAVLSAPQCWDGVNLDSSDHRSHMAYMSYDRGDGKSYCPDTHPKIIPTFTLLMTFTVDETLNTSGTWDGTYNSWHLVSDNMPGMNMRMKPGKSLHADWFGGWDDIAMDMWHDHCIDKELSCSGGDLGNGLQLKMFKDFSWLADPQKVPLSEIDKQTGWKPEYLR